MPTLNGLVTDRTSRILTANMFEYDPPMLNITPRDLSAALMNAILSYYSHLASFVSDPPTNGAQLCFILGTTVHNRCTDPCTADLTCAPIVYDSAQLVHNVACTIVHNPPATLCTDCVNDVVYSVVHELS